MSERMENAMKLAEKCWEKANKTHPDFVERYLELAEVLLVNKSAVSGDEFKEHCENNSLFRPSTLHHNVWVSGVRALNSLGWITRVQKIEPVKAHNHMPIVTLWRSALFYGEK